MDSASHTTKPGSHSHHHPQPSPSHLLSSAKVVAEAAKTTFRRESGGKIDKTKLAEAAEDILVGASHYGKLEGKSYGKYVEKAETYLHQYHSSSSSHSSTTTTTTPHSSSTTTTHSSTGNSHSEGGSYGDYIKLAQGFLKKR